MAPGHPEGALAVARAALDAREFATARAALEPLRAASRRSASPMLMAELEELEGDEGRAREWMARALNAARDPAWTADGFVSERWLPVSPVTGRLDAFQWKVPVAELGERAPVLIEAPADAAPGRAPAGAAARGAVAAARQRDAGAGAAPRCRAAAVARPRCGRRRSSRWRRCRTTPAPSREDAELVEPRRRRSPGNGFVSFSGEAGRSGNGPAGFGVPVRCSGLRPAVTFLRFCPQATIQVPPRIRRGSSAGRAPHS